MSEIQPFAGFDVEATAEAILAAVDLMPDQCGGRTMSERIADVLRAALPPAPTGVDGAVAELATLPRDGLAFVVLRFPGEGDDPIDHSAALKRVAERVREANPNGYVLVLPAGWSFRMMPPGQARDFARNMLAFVSDDELAEIGLTRDGSIEVNRG